MWAWLSAACFLVALVLYAVSAGKVPFTSTGFALLGLILLAVHAAPGSYGWRRS
jgi:hypothetical protein